MSERDPSSAIKMTVRGLIMDPASNSPVVILQNDEGTTFLPIWIGVCEANSIALELEGVEPPRPMTHDLLRDLIASTLPDFSADDQIGRARFVLDGDEGDALGRAGALTQ